MVGGNAIKYDMKEVTQLSVAYLLTVTYLRRATIAVPAGTQGEYRDDKPLWGQSSYE